MNMYVKCHSLSMAQQVFDKLSTHNVVCWTMLISGYVEHDRGEEALACLESVQKKGFSPTECTYVCSLKACILIGAIDKGSHLHAEIVKRGWEKDEVLCNMLIDFYAKLGNIESAQRIFDLLIHKDVISWTTLIGGYIQHDDAQKALSLFKQMEEMGILPNSFTLVCSLKACAKTGAIMEGQDIHHQACNMDLETDTLVGTALVNMYCKCGLLADAQYIFDKILIQDTVLWTALIGGYIEHGYGEEALHYYKKMQLQVYDSNPITLVYGLRACGSTSEASKGYELHSDIIKKGLDCDSFITSSLVCMYANCDMLAAAELLLHKLPLQDIAPWNVLLTRYVDNGYFEQTLECFEQMRHEFVPLSTVSFVSGTKACSSLGDVMCGQNMHMEILKLGFEGDIVVSSTVMDMYMKCGLFSEALNVFNSLATHDVISWTLLIMGCVHHGNGEDAICIYEQMLCKGVCVNSITYVGILMACSCIGKILNGREIHSMVIKRGLEDEPRICTALTDMYAKCGMLPEAHKVCAKSQNFDPISSTALIAGYAEQGCGENALSLMEQLENAGVSGNIITLGSSLRACGSLGALDKGLLMHSEVIGKGFEGDSIMGFTLVDMYSKCASLAEARYTFDRLAIVNVLSWNALIAGYTQIAEIDNVIICFVSMLQEGIHPDSVTFMNILNTCGDTGSTELAHFFFQILNNDYSYILIVEHVTCMIDLFCRTGCIDKALSVVKTMMFHPHAALWHAILGACLRSRDLELGKHAFEHASTLDENDTVAHILLSNIYVNAETSMGW
ncbi:hypothetical protein KP509_16G081600 [Ceratopteris richardii]|nr:hypothetical protein KP509_16G081600 [Ceratopteris richardii]